ncbi:MAG TPA: hypothetical protein VMY18_14470, partial [Acidobacteriota bacterium]|nr:hypothetical protein [Acidobacteriota bacterium]
LKLMPPRKPGRYTAEIVLQTQERGLLGGLSPFGWKEATSTEVNFEVVGKDRLTVEPPESLKLGIIKTGKPPYTPTKDETVLLGINAVLEVLGASIPGYAAGTKAELQPSLLAACVVLKNPKLEEAEGEKVLTLQARVLEAKTGSAKYPFYAPGFDRVVFTVELPDGASVPEQDYWLVEHRNGRQVAIGIVDGIDKQIGRSKTLREPSLRLRYSDGEVDGEYRLNVTAMGLVGPFGQEAADDDLKEAPIWPETPLSVRPRSRLEKAPWVYDYQLWQKQPEQSAWYIMSASMPVTLRGKPTRVELPRRQRIWQVLKLSKDDLPRGFRFLEESPGKTPGPWEGITDNPGFVDMALLKTALKKGAAHDPDFVDHPLASVERWYVALFSRPGMDFYLGYCVFEWDAEAEAARFLTRVARPGTEGDAGTFRYNGFVVNFMAQNADHHGVVLPKDLKDWTERMIEALQAKLRGLDAR